MNKLQKLNAGKISVRNISGALKERTTSTSKQYDDVIAHAINSMNTKLQNDFQNIDVQKKLDNVMAPPYYSDVKHAIPRVQEKMDALNKMIADMPKNPTEAYLDKVVKTLSSAEFGIKEIQKSQRLPQFLSYLRALSLNLK